jgi:hypothetical protein
LVVVVVGRKQATWEWLAARFQIWVSPGRRAPRVGHLDLSSIFRQAAMAQLARALAAVSPGLGSIHVCCKIYILSNIVRTL